MRKRIVVLLSAVAWSVPGLVFGAASPAMAYNWDEPVYNIDGLYVGCFSEFSGHFYTVDEITELGCNTDIELPIID